MHPTTLLAAVNKQHGTSFTLSNRYPHGESGFGAYAVIDAMGQRGVLKYAPQPNHIKRLHAIGAAIARLRSFGYPAPRYLVVGCLPTACYSIQELLPGMPLQTITPELVPRIIELNLIQRGQALDGRQDWPRPVVDAVLHGGDGFCLLDPMRTYSTATAALLHMLQALVRQHQNALYPTGDIVHIDFNPTNILVHNGEISGVIDWQDLHAGDCAFDLATLLFYSWDIPAVRDRLWQHIIKRVGPSVLSVYLAHMSLRQVDWSIRHHGTQAVTMWLHVAQESLARCAAA